MSDKVLTQKLLASIQAQVGKADRPLSRYIPFTCLDCNHSDAFNKRPKVCPECGSIGRMQKWNELQTDWQDLRRRNPQKKESA